MARLARKGGKIYDTGTSNKSFLQVACDLKTLGIKNYYFILEIKDTTLDSKADKSDTYTKTEVDSAIQTAILDSWEVSV